MESASGHHRPHVSVIVPVYNVAKYLPQCIESVLEQTYTDWKLVLVDDGSPDESGHICDEYALRDPRIEVHHTPNGGVARARNIGLQHAEGEWVMFLDADDWLDAECVAKIVAAAEQNGVDFLQFSYTRTTEDGVMLNSCTHGAVVWNCLFCLHLVLENKITFPETMKLWEDQYFLCRYLTYSTKCMDYPESLYYYRINPGSVTFRRKPEDLITAIKEFRQFPDRDGQAVMLSERIRTTILISFIQLINIDTRLPYKTLRGLIQGEKFTDLFRRGSLSIKLFVVLDLFSRRLAIGTTKVCYRMWHLIRGK